MLIKIEDGKVKVQSEYNREFVKKAHEVQGKWESPFWTFPEENEELVRNALFEVYGEDGRVHETVSVDLDMEKYPYGRTVNLDSVEIAVRKWRDSPVQVAGNTIVIAGGFCDCGGSRTNPRVTCETGTVLRIKDIPVEIYNRIKDLPGVIKVDLDADENKKEKKAALEREKERLLKRLAEIKEALGRL